MCFYRWASITFRTQEEREDAVSLFGGRNAINHPELHRAGFLALHPLYRSVPENDQAYLRAPKTFDDPRTPPAIQVRTNQADPVHAKRVCTYWVPVGDEFYEERDCNRGNPHYLHVSEHDSVTPSIAWIYGEAVQKVEEEMKERARQTGLSEVTLYILQSIIADKLNFLKIYCILLLICVQEDDPYPSTFEDVIEFSQQCDAEWGQVEEWSNSDAKYGNTYPGNDCMPSYPLWRRSKKQLAATSSFQATASMSKGFY